MSLASWSGGKAGVWEYSTTVDGEQFFDEGEAYRHWHDNHELGDVLVRPFGSTEWGLSSRGRSALRLCDVTSGVLECSRDAGHDGEHRAHVSHDLSRAYTVIGDPHDGETVDHGGWEDR